MCALSCLAYYKYTYSRLSTSFTSFILSQNCYHGMVLNPSSHKIEIKGILGLILNCNSLKQVSSELGFCCCLELDVDFSKSMDFHVIYE